MNTAERLEQIEQWLHVNRPDYLSLLEPPAADDALRSADEEFGFELPDTLKTLYRWHNGQKPREFTPLLYNLTFMTLSEVIVTKEALDHVAEFDHGREIRGGRDGFHFLTTGAAIICAWISVASKLGTLGNCYGSITKHMSKRSYMRV